jgi:Domain of unknown function (DUF4189)
MAYDSLHAHVHWYLISVFLMMLTIRHRNLGGIFCSLARTRRRIVTQGNISLVGTVFRLLGAALLGMLCLPGSAKAEGRCPPGYYPTGGNDVGWLGCAPMGPTEQDAPNDEPDQGPPPEPDMYMAVVAHRDTSALWTTSGHDSRAAAEKAALRACGKQMKNGCYVSWWGVNDFTVAVAHDVAGLFFVEGDINRNAARSKVLTACQEQSIGCEIVRVIANSARRQDNFPKSSPPIHKYVVIAWPKVTAPPYWQRKYWLVSGISGYEAAVDAAIKRCAADTGRECVRGQHSSAGVIARFIDDAGTTYWIDAANAEAASKRVLENCPQGRQCRIVELYAANQARTSVLDEDRADGPTRGFYSIAWPHSGAKSQKLALVTGQLSRQVAREKAIALCESENQTACRPYLDEEDWGTEQFIAMLYDSSKRTRVEFGYSAKQAGEKMAESCKHDNVVCPKWQIFDLSKPVSTTIDLRMAR